MKMFIKVLLVFFLLGSFAQDSKAANNADTNDLDAQILALEKEIARDNERKERARRRAEALRRVRGGVDTPQQSGKKTSRDEDPNTNPPDPEEPPHTKNHAARERPLGKTHRAEPLQDDHHQSRRTANGSGDAVTGRVDIESVAAAFLPLTRDKLDKLIAAPELTPILTHLCTTRPEAVGALVDTLNAEGQTPLAQAIFQGNEPAVMCLAPLTDLNQSFRRDASWTTFLKGGDREFKRRFVIIPTLAKTNFTYYLHLAADHATDNIFAILYDTFMEKHTTESAAKTALALVDDAGDTVAQIVIRLSKQAKLAKLLSHSKALQLDKLLECAAECINAACKISFAEADLPIKLFHDIAEQIRIDASIIPGSYTIDKIQDFIRRRIVEKEIQNSMYQRYEELHKSSATRYPKAPPTLLRVITGLLGNSK